MSHQNFEVYKALAVPRTYLVVATSAGLDAGPPVAKNGFGSAPARESLADELAAAYEAAGREPVAMTLKVHGYNVRRGSFEREVISDARDERPAAGGASSERETFRPDDRFLVGFRWPSEGLSSRESWRDATAAVLLTPAIGVLMLLLPLHGLLVRGDLEQLLWPVSPWLAEATRLLATIIVRLETPFVTWFHEHLPWWGGLLHAALAPFSGPTAGAIWLGAGALMLMLRLSTYARDRYRAIHFGVPDLGEFLKELEQALHARRARVRLDVIGHSMGTLLLINAFRVMSDFFRGLREGTDGSPPGGYNELGRDGTFQLGSLILCAPDIPAVMATPDHNNYFLSALRRFETVHVFSSDRDLILKWLSSLANWTSEPRFDMAGRKLGNVHLVRAKLATGRGPDSRADWTIFPMTRPMFRSYPLYPSDPLGRSAPALIHFHDCTTDMSVSGSYVSMFGASVALSTLLWLVGRALGSAALAWLGAGLGTMLLVGLVARPLWPRLRDVPWLGGLVGALAESPTLMMFVTSWRAWNPHSGYFMLGQQPRQRIGRLLREPHAFPPRDSAGVPMEEQDGPIRYRMVRVSV
jgi:hypothetical protein